MTLMVFRKQAGRWSVTALASVVFLCGVVVVAEPGRGPRNDATFQAILQAANEQNRDIRARVAWVIGQMERRDADSVLVRLATDETVGVRAAALSAMVKLLPRGTEVRVRLTVPVADTVLREAALVAARHVRFEQRSKLIKTALDSTFVSERILGTRALALDTPDSARPLVEKMYHSPHALVRAAAVHTLGFATDDNAAKLVLDALAETTADDSFVVRAVACDAFARMNISRGRDQLYQALRDKHYFVRRSAVEAIEALNDSAGVPIVQQCITDDDYTIRVAACRTLGKIIAAVSPLYLAPRLADKVPEVREAADDALKTFPPDLAHRALLKWVDYRRRKETRMRVWRLLGEYGHPGTSAAAFRHLDDDAPFVRVDAFRILRKLKDERIIPRTMALLRTDRATMMKRAPLEGLIVEAFKAGAVFELRDGIDLALFAFARSMTTALDGGYMPSGEALIAAAEYVVAVDARKAVKVLERMYKGATGEDGMMAPGGNGVMEAVASALESFTGKPHPLPLPPPRSKPVGVYFIDIPTKTE